MSLTETERLVGAALGQAVGDFLGFQVERGPGERALAFGVRAFEKAANLSPLRSPWPVGQVSDDTQLSLKLLAHLRAATGSLEGAKFDADAFALELAAYRRSVVGIGGGTSAVLNAIAAGTPWRDAARLNANPTNGGAMRVWPLAFVCAGAGLAKCSMLVASITHSHPAAQQAAAAVTTSVRHLVDGGSPATLIPVLHAFAHNFGMATCERIAAHVEDCFAYPQDALARTWALSGGGGEEWKHISPLAVPTVAWALYSFVRSQGDFKEAILDSLSAGGDVDSVAAIAGTLCGAMNGPSAIPDSLVAMARDGDEWDGESLRRTLAGDRLPLSPR